MNLTAFAVLALLALAVAAISMTITKSRAFKGFRGWIKDKVKILSGLFDCPYCMSHWGALAVVWIYKPWVVSSGFFVIDLIVHTFATVAIAAPICGLIYVSFRKMLEDVEPEDEEVVEIDDKAGIEDEVIKIADDEKGEEEEEEDEALSKITEDEPEDDEAVQKKLDKRGKGLGTGSDLTAEKEKVIAAEKPKKFVKKGKKPESDNPNLGEAVKEVQEKDKKKPGSALNRLKARRSKPKPGPKKEEPAKPEEKPALAAVAAPPEGS